MDFVALLARPGSGAAGRDDAPRSAIALAGPGRLRRLRHDGRDLPVWVDEPEAWQAVRDGEGDIRIGAARDGGPGSGPFPAAAAAPRTAPLFRIGGDGRSGSVATDLIGIETVYRREVPGGVLIASRSSWLVPPGERRMDLLAAFHFLNFMAVPSPFSIFAGVARVPPGSLVAAGPSTSVETFRDLEYGEGEIAGGVPDREVASRVFVRIREAIARAIRNVDPRCLGSFLSGGTDSTTVAGLAARMLGGLDVFSVIYGERDFSEEEFVAEAARRFPLRSHRFLLDERGFVESLEPVLGAHDEPYANSSVIAAHRVFEMARGLGKKILLTGDGGDEIFGGNQRYADRQVYAAYNSIPGPLRRFWEGPIGRMEARSHGIRRLQKAFRRAALPEPDRFYLGDAFASERWEELRGPAFRDARFRPDASLAHVRELYRRAPARSELDRLLYIDMKLTIADNDLRKIVRTGTLHGVESRFPLLDIRLVDLVDRLDPRLKVRGTTKRVIFKEALRDFLPPTILYKKKQGMGLPLGRWLRGGGPVAEFARASIDSAEGRALFDGKFAGRIWEEHRQGSWNHGHDLWRMAVLADWARRHGAGSFATAETVVETAR